MRRFCFFSLRWPLIIGLAILGLPIIGLSTIGLSSTPALARELSVQNFPVQNFQHAQIHAVDRSGDLASDFRTLAKRIQAPAWVSYALPRAARHQPYEHHHVGSHHEASQHGASHCGTYYLEGRQQGHSQQNIHDDGKSETFLVLLRVADGEVRKIHGISSACDIDAGGLDVHAFSAVDPRQSLDLVVSLAEAAGRRVREPSLFVIAQHDEPAVDPLLEEIATGARDWDQQNQAVFWLGVRGRRGFEILRRLARTHDDADLRHHITFGIYVARDAGSVPLLIEMARGDKAREVRRQAMFWLAQEASREAVDELERASEEDPDVEIKKHAIFALSQLPAERGVPLLIRHAKTHPHPAVRKQALFWLGQSGDEKALEFIEDILTR